jgi:FAD/FMN-containing dehydrogenase
MSTVSTVTKLRELLSPAQVLDDAANLEEYGKDWTKHLTPNPVAIVFPKTTEEVQKIVKWARKEKVALVPSGGRTGLSGAAVALNGEVVVSFEKMNRILDFNEADSTMTVEAGVVTETAQKFAEEKHMYFPVDFASRGSSQIGGNVATNAGGIKVLRYGLIRPWVQAMDVVTGAGEILKLNNSLVKNATGYDLRQLFIGSEGTLGFVTKITLGLTRPPTSPQLFLFGLAELESVMKVYHAFKKDLPLLAFEMFTELALECVLKQHKDLSRPLQEPQPYYVLAEVEGDSESVIEKALGIFEKGLEEGFINDGIQSQSPQQARDLWRLREDISEATSPYKPYKNDISVRISRVPAFLTEMDAILKREYPDIQVVWFGHIGDGNLHINILKPEKLSSEEFVARCKKVDTILFEMIHRFEGSISAEHGVGLTKKPFLHFTRSEEEIQLMRGIKKVFDPDGIMNPGKVF